MKGRLALLNLALAALAAAGAWQLRVRWLEARAREKALYETQVKPAAPAPVVPAPPAAPAAPVRAIDYGEVAGKMLFSRDRNPTVEIEAAPPKPMPPMPVAYGVMAFGDVRSAILSPRPGLPHKAFEPGQQVGELKLVSVSPEELVFEWEGQTIVKKLEELMSKEQPAQAAPEAAPAAAQPAATVVNATPAAPVKPGPGAQLTPEMRACVPGDPTPAGTVMEGFRKIVTQTPFGERCRWEVAR